jgi:hypothetical protein
LLRTRYRKGIPNTARADDRAASCKPSVWPNVESVLPIISMTVGILSKTNKVREHIAVRMKTTFVLFVISHLQNRISSKIILTY